MFIPFYLYMKDKPNQMKRGRKPVEVTWPRVEFTASDVAKQMQGRLSRVSVHSKLNKAVETGEITIMRKTSGKMGRPHVIYKVK